MERQSRTSSGQSKTLRLFEEGEMQSSYSLKKGSVGNMSLSAHRGSLGLSKGFRKP